MFKWERRLTGWVDRHLPELIFVLITLIAAFMRFREGIWHVSFDYQNQFYPELPTYTHTPFYTFFMRMICYIPVTPIRTMKYIICLFDFVVALEGTVLLGRLRGRREKTVTLACYGLLLISPLAIADGLIWIHVDSICLSAVLGACLLAGKKKSSRINLPSVGLLLGVAAALQMQYSVFWVIAVIWSAGKQKRALPWLGAGAVLAGILTAVGILSEGMRVGEGLFALVSWLVTDQASGEMYAGIVPWIAQMAGQFGYLAGTAALLYAFYRPRRSPAAAVVYIGATVYLGCILRCGWPAG